VLESSKLDELFQAADLNQDGYLDWNSGEVSSFGQAVSDSMADQLSTSEGGRKFLTQATLYNLFDDVDKNIDAKMDSKEAVQFAMRCVAAALRTNHVSEQVNGVSLLSSSRRTLSSPAASSKQLVAEVLPRGMNFSGEIAESVGIIFDVSDAQGLSDREGRGFPHSLGPFHLEPTVGIAPAALQISEPVSSSPYAMRQWTLDREALGTASLQLLAGTLLSPGTSMTGHLSPRHPVKYPQSTVSTLQLPPGAEHYAWSYPLEVSWSSLPDENLSADDPDTTFLRNGGFVYFDSSFNVVGVAAMQYSATGALCFGSPRQVALSWIDPLVRAGRFHTITLHDLGEESMTPLCEHCWIAPHEVSGLCPCGGFAYLFRTSIVRTVRSVTAKPIPIVSWGVDPQRLVQVSQQPQPSFKSEELLNRIQELEDQRVQLSSRNTVLESQNEQLVLDLRIRAEENSKLAEQVGVIGKLEERGAQLAGELSHAHEQNAALLQLVQETEEMLHKERSAAASALEANAGLDAAAKAQLEELEQENLHLRQALSALRGSQEEERGLADHLSDAHKENAQLSGMVQQLEELLHQAEERLEAQSRSPAPAAKVAVPREASDSDLRLQHENRELRDRLKILEAREKRMSDELDRMLAEKDGMARQLDRLIAERDGMARRLQDAEGRPSTGQPQQAFKFPCC